MEIKDDRAREIYPYIKDKFVLDVGCYAEIKDRVNSEEKGSDDRWIHGFLTKYSTHVVGIDITKENIEILKKQGYDVYCQNAETFKLDKKFDVIFAGDVIEHLSNPGLFIDRCRKHLKKEGWLILTTPNVFCLNSKIGSIIRFSNNDLEVHPEHTCFYSPTVIGTLLKRYSFYIKKVIFVNFTQVDSFKKRIQNMLCNIFGDKLRESMIIFSKQENEIKEK
jgi:SAM-dependent methyltransferase